MLLNKSFQPFSMLLIVEDAHCTTADQARSFMCHGAKQIDKNCSRCDNKFASTLSDRLWDTIIIRWAGIQPDWIHPPPWEIPEIEEHNLMNTMRSIACQLVSESQNVQIHLTKYPRHQLAFIIHSQHSYHRFERIKGIFFEDRHFEHKCMFETLIETGFSNSLKQRLP